MIILKKALYAILALVLCISVVFAGCANNPDDDVKGGVSENADTEEEAAVVLSDNKIEEGEETSQADLGTEVELFIGGTYYLEGTIYSSGQALPAKLATDGKNVQCTTEVYGIRIGFLLLDDNTFITLPSENVYTELSQTLVSAIGIDDFDVSELQGLKPGEETEQATIKQFAVTINGDAGLCTEYSYKDSTIKLYSIGDKLVQVDNYDTTGKITMQMVISSIAKDIPSDQLTLKGLSDSSVTSFISSFMKLATNAVA